LETSSKHCTNLVLCIAAGNLTQQVFQTQS
jgi:hypothetical protein